MGIGVGLFLIALGAILTFALNVDIGGFNLDAVGWILMLTGLVGIILTFTIWKPRQRRIVTERRTLPERQPGMYTDRPPGTYERRVYDEEPPPV